MRTSSRTLWGEGQPLWPGIATSLVEKDGTEKADVSWALKERNSIPLSSGSVLGADHIRGKVGLSQLCAGRRVKDLVGTAEPWRVRREVV